MGERRCPGQKRGGVWHETSEKDKRKLEESLNRAIEFFGLGADPLHDSGVLLSLLVLGGGMLAFPFRVRAALAGRPRLGSLQVHRMIAVLGVLGGFVAYLRELAYSHGLQDLTLGGISAIPWMGIIALELFRGPGGK